MKQRILQAIIAALLIFQTCLGLAACDPQVDRALMGTSKLSGRQYLEQQLAKGVDINEIGRCISNILLDWEQSLEGARFGILKVDEQFKQDIASAKYLVDTVLDHPKLKREVLHLAFCTALDVSDEELMQYIISKVRKNAKSYDDFTWIVNTPCPCILPLAKLQYRFLHVPSIANQKVMEALSDIPTNSYNLSLFLSEHALDRATRDHYRKLSAEYIKEIEKMLKESDK